MPSTSPIEPTGAAGTSRRRFLWGSGAAAAGGVALFARGAGVDPSGETVTLWRLNAAWGYPAGPKQVTACRCTACHHHAANKVWFSESDAIAGRIHACCVCQSESFTVPASTGDELLAMSSDGVSVDRRHAGIAAVLASGSTPTPTVDPPADPGNTGGGNGSGGNGSAGGSGGTDEGTTGSGGGGPGSGPASVGNTEGVFPADAAPPSGDVAPTRAACPAALAFTGGGTAAPLGVLALGAGVVMWGVGRRRMLVAGDTPAAPSPGGSADTSSGATDRRSGPGGS